MILPWWKYAIGCVLLVWFVMVVLDEANRKALRDSMHRNRGAARWE